MTLLPIRECWDEWNRLVPTAQSLGIRVRPRAYTRTSREEANERLTWLRDQISLRGGLLSSTASVTNLPVDMMAQTFGVEFEVMMPRGVSHAGLAARIDAAGVPCRSEMYNHNVRLAWKVVTDGSLGNYSRGAEVVSPILMGESGLEEVRKVCQVMLLAGCKVSKKCGLHVHVGMRDRGFGAIQSLVRLYRTYDPVIDRFMAPSRRARQNVFCTPVDVPEDLLARATQVSDLGRWGSPDRYTGYRYRKLNLCSFPVYGTVEFRQHQGTVEARKAQMWIRLCLRMTHWAVRNQGWTLDAVRPLSTDSFMEMIEADAEERAFFRSRVEDFDRRDQRALARVTRSLAA